MRASPATVTPAAARMAVSAGAQASRHYAGALDLGHRQPRRTAGRSSNCTLSWETDGGIWQGRPRCFPPEVLACPWVRGYWAGLGADSAQRGCRELGGETLRKGF